MKIYIFICSFSSLNVFFFKTKPKQCILVVQRMEKRRQKTKTTTTITTITTTIIITTTAAAVVAAVFVLVVMRITQEIHQIDVNVVQICLNVRC